MNILITGGCGFIGSSLAVKLLQMGHSITCLDNLSRRGSEYLLMRVKEHGGVFQHGDVRNPEDFERLPLHYDVMLECSAEPSVLVGSSGKDAPFMVQNNLNGSLNCFEYARKTGCGVIFFSTSRVYPYDVLNRMQCEELPTRFACADTLPGLSDAGISTAFPIAGRRSLYGATKLASELILQEYCAQYEVPAIINRLGVIAGPWQLGKVDQGVFTHWLIQHVRKGNLSYIGYGGTGKQVRDLLHVDDLTALIVCQLQKLSSCRGEVYNAGGGSACSLSLLEASQICEQITGNMLHIGSSPENRPADIPWYVTDNRATYEAFGWEPTRTPLQVVMDTYNWLCENEVLLGSIQ